MKIYEPGIYDISNEEYHASAGISKSGILLFMRSPLHYWHRYLNTNSKPTTTKALDEGKLFNTLVLEKEKFNALYIIRSNAPGNTTTGKTEIAKLKLIANGRQIITENQYKKFSKMKTILESEPIILESIKNAQYEKSFFWIDEDTKVLCKTRPDIWRENILCELKTTRDASENAFLKDIKKYGYRIQAAMQHDGVKAVTGKDTNIFTFIAIEKEEPYALGIRRLKPKGIEIGREQYKEALLKYKYCLEKNYWPSYDVSEIE